MIMKLQILFLIAMSFAITPVLAVDRCNSKEDNENTSAFQNSFEAAKNLAKELCEKHIKQEETPSEQTVESIREKADIWKMAALAETDSLKTAEIDLSVIIGHIYDEIINGEPYVTLEVERSPSLFYKASDGVQIPIDDNSRCMSLGSGLNCYKTLTQFSKITKTINSSVNVVTLDETYKQLGLYSNAWSKYFTKARSQTFIELSMNTWRYSDELQKGKNVPPPSSQLILLHPSVAIEYVDNAVDGQQQKEALVMEWIGMNWWDLSVPLGFSVVSSYTDRQGLDDHAWGLMFHFYNNYSIAYTHRSGGDGVMFTVDLLKLFEDKKTNLDNYKNEIEDDMKKQKY